MKKIFKKIGLLLAPVVISTGCLSVLPMTSCSTKMHTKVKQIAPYLHEITFNDYTYDSEWVTTQEAEAFGCSSVRNGNFYGRNFDYVFNDVPEFIVKVNANAEKKRHASIGMATHFGLRERRLLNNEYSKQLDLIPNITLDGINDAGVICSHNVVSMDDANPLKEDGTRTYVDETHPGAAQKIHMLFVPRYVLDNANSAEEAVQLLTKETLNIAGNLNNHYYLHVMIADAKETYVVEFFHKNESNHNHFDVVWQKKEHGNEIMTNYYVNNDGSINNQNKNGVERMAILKNSYADSASMAGMENLMKKVRFSNAYRYNHNHEPYVEGTTHTDLNSEWYSEFIKQDDITEHSESTQGWEWLQGKMNPLKQDYWIDRIMDNRNPSNPAFWITTHNSTYDIQNKHLQVIVQENYEVAFDYYL